MSPYSVYYPPIQTKITRNGLEIFFALFKIINQATFTQMAFNSAKSLINEQYRQLSSRTKESTFEDYLAQLQSSDPAPRTSLFTKTLQPVLARGSNAYKSHYQLPRNS